MMRRTFASLSLAALLALNVTGCGSTEPATPAKPESTTPAPAPEPVTKGGKGTAPTVEISNPKMED